MPSPDFSASSANAIESTAAQWLARRDRGLTGAEEAEFAAWREADLRHEAAFLRLEQVWSALDRVTLSTEAAKMAAEADPAATPRRRSHLLWLPLLAAAAAAVFIFTRPAAPPAAAPVTRAHAIVHPGPERRVLEDGSFIDLKPGAEVNVQFTPEARHVRLLRGEAYFTVAKNPARPFIVSAHQVSVRAVGTAFSVGFDPREISVLVTEGRVRVDEASSADPAAALRPLSALQAGDLGVIALAADSTDSGGLAMAVSRPTPAAIEQALAWQGLRLEFIAMPLGDVAADFNRYNRRKLVVPDAATAAILVGGNFRADNVEAFVRLLALSFNVAAYPQGDEIILRQAADR